MIVFVYGSLMSGFYNHTLMEGADFISDGRVYDMALYSRGAYPCAVHGIGWVEGELWEVSAAQEQALDCLEGHPAFYKREPMTVHTETGAHTAWMYIYQGDVRSMPRVDSGSWRKEKGQ